MPTLKVFNGTDWIEIKGAKGDPGDPGEPGSAASITSVTATTGTAGSQAAVTLGGTPQARTFAFTIPKGDKGDTGNTGSPGTAATITTVTATGLPAGATPTVTAGGTSTARTFAFGIPKGDKGDTGNQGIPGEKGDPGENPFHIGTTAPANPSIKSIWFDPTP